MATLPAAMRTRIDRLTILGDADLASDLATREQAEVDLDARFGPNRRLLPQAPPAA